jgi:hypothetical protein
MMTDFLLIYEGGDKSWMETATPEQMETVMQEWGAWFKQLESTGNLRNPGGPLGNDGTLVSRNGDRIDTDTTMSEVKELISGYSIIAAASQKEASELAKGCPLLAGTDGGRVQVRPILPM